MRPHRASLLRSCFLAWTLAAAATGCADAVPSDSDADGADAGVAAVAAKADGASASELRVRTGQLTVWLSVQATLDASGTSGPRLVISGRASRDLESASSWVPDDAFGTVTIKSKRTFDIVLDQPSEVNTVLAGSPLYLTLRSKTGTPRDYYVRVGLEPRLAKFSGAKEIWLRDAVAPVYVRDGRQNLRYRALATTTTPAAVFTATTADGPVPDVRGAGVGRYEIDFGFDALIAAMTPASDRVTFGATWAGAAGAAPRTLTKRAALVATVAKLAISTDDPYAALVVNPSCDESVRRCIAGQSGDDDLGVCGAYRDVATCLASGPICGATSPALALREVETPELDANVSAFDAAQAAAGASGRIVALVDQRLPVCLASTPTLDALVDLVRADELGLFAAGARLTRAEVLQTRFLGGSEAGAQLLGVLDGWQGSPKAEYWYAEERAGDSGSALVVAYYPATGRVFTLHGTF